MAARITLSRYGVSPADYEYLAGHRIRVEAAVTEGESEGVEGDAEAGTMTDKIFMWHVGAVHGTSGDQPAWYERVANLADLWNYPEDEADLESDYPSYRANFFEIDVPTLADADRIWANVRARVKALCDAFNAYSSLEVIETVEIE